MCPHGGIINHVPLTPCNYKIHGMPPLLLTDHYIVMGCPYQSPVTGGYMVPTPCMQVSQWLNPSVNLLVRGVPVLLNSSNGICSDAMGGIHQPVVIATFQTFVREPDTLTQED